MQNGNAISIADCVHNVEQNVDNLPFLSERGQGAPPYDTNIVCGDIKINDDNNVLQQAAAGSAWSFRAFCARIIQSILNYFSPWLLWLAVFALLFVVGYKLQLKQYAKERGDMRKIKFAENYGSVMDGEEEEGEEEGDEEHNNNTNSPSCETEESEDREDTLVVY